MSVHVPITVQFQVDKADVLQGVARRHMDRMSPLDAGDDAWDRDAFRFLEHAAEGKGVALGPRGDMFTWGSVGNYTNVGDFVSVLRPFWEELYRERALWDFVGIVVMSQTEQRMVSTVVEISKDQTAPRRESPLVVRFWETPFPLFEGFIERPEALVPPGVHTEIWGNGR